jgi:hypothetical protein
MEQHLALQTQVNVRAGMPATEARRQAALKFGAVEAIRESYRAGRGLADDRNCLTGLSLCLSYVVQVSGP